ncbi:hypothetical protein FRC02_003558 [Tulasnella sp. 418]|nr:hypothetical protein FRC02_003558 [Tulasnella sp. 418]
MAYHPPPGGYYYPPPAYPHLAYNPHMYQYGYYHYPHPLQIPHHPIPPPQPPQPIVDPALLNENPNFPPAPKAPASPTDSYDDDDDDDENDNDSKEQRFGTLHPVSYPSPPPPPDEEEEEAPPLDDKKDMDYTEQAPPPKKSRRSQGRSTARVPAVAPVPLPNFDADSDLTPEKISKFQSPVRNLKHIDLTLFPPRQLFESILYTYQANLSARKRNKALISREAYAEIQMTLVEIKELRCRRGTAQYRFWVKKMFRLINFYGNDVVGHQGKPVAIREDIFDILVHCHDQCDHGGRDRTVEVVKEFYVRIRHVDPSPLNL